MQPAVEQVTAGRSTGTLVEEGSGNRQTIREEEDRTGHPEGDPVGTDERLPGRPSQRSARTCRGRREGSQSEAWKARSSCRRVRHLQAQGAGTWVNEEAAHGTSLVVQSRRNDQAVHSTIPVGTGKLRQRQSLQSQRCREGPRLWRGDRETSQEAPVHSSRRGVGIQQMREGGD